MFKKILVAEDHNTNNFAIKNSLQDLIPVINQVYFCDEAYYLIEKEASVNNPFELLITDLSFAEVHPQFLKGGIELIKIVREKFPMLKIIVFSIENRTNKIQKLFEEYDIEGFISKGRNDIKYLIKAIHKIYSGEKNIFFGSNNVFELKPVDEEIIFLIAKGMNAKEISVQLKMKKVLPNSESYINKRLMYLRRAVGAENTIHLLIKMIDLGILNKG